MLQNVRKSKGFSQKQLADASGVSVRMVQHYEQGYKDIDRASLDTICKLANALHCPLWEILNNENLKQEVKKVTAQ